MSTNSDQQRYRMHCRAEPSVPIFSQDWWLDALVGKEGWGAVLVERGGETVGSMPFLYRRHLGFRWLSQPPLTHTLGPWIRPSHAKSAHALGFEKDVMEALIDQLPKFDHFVQNWHYSRTNWLPFYWRGFSQTTRYTYVLPNLSDQEALWAAMRSNIRQDIRKASQRFGLRVRQDLGVDALMPLVSKTFSRQGKHQPYPEAMVRRLDAACAARGCRRIFIAEDGEGRRHAGEYWVWDTNAAYGILAGADPALRSSGATSLCRWEAIRFASGVTRSVDFDGSMLEPVERYFRAFGAEQRQYTRVWKTNSRALRFALFLLAVL